jgi:hypothetical protein
MGAADSRKRAFGDLRLRDHDLVAAFDVGAGASALRPLAFDPHFDDFFPILAAFRRATF